MVEAQFRSAGHAIADVIRMPRSDASGGSRRRWRRCQACRCRSSVVSRIGAASATGTSRSASLPLSGRSSPRSWPRRSPGEEQRHPGVTQRERLIQIAPMPRLAPQRPANPTGGPRASPGALIDPPRPGPAASSRGSTPRDRAMRVVVGPPALHSTSNFVNVGWRSAATSRSRTIRTSRTRPHVARTHRRSGFQPRRRGAVRSLGRWRWRSFTSAFGSIMAPSRPSQPQTVSPIVLFVTPATAFADVATPVVLRSLSACSKRGLCPRRWLAFCLPAVEGLECRRNTPRTSIPVVEAPVSSDPDRPDPRERAASEVLRTPYSRDVRRTAVTSGTRRRADT